MSRDWLENAGCLDTDPELFHPRSCRPAAYAPALAVCSACPVKEDCLADALRVERGHPRHGVRGAMTPHERLMLEQRSHAVV